KWTVPDAPLQLGTKAWRPNLVIAGDEKRRPAVLHVHISASMPRWIKTRLGAAAADHQVFVALTMEALYDEDVLKVLSDVDADVVVYGDGSDGKSAYVLAAIADRSIPVSTELSREMATRS